MKFKITREMFLQSAEAMKARRAFETKPLALPQSLYWSQNCPIVLGANAALGTKNSLGVGFLREVGVDNPKTYQLSQASRDLRARFDNSEPEALAANPETEIEMTEVTE